jgi:hypothetical protein
VSKLKYPRWEYIKHALAHPWHVVVLAGATVFGVANWSIWVLLIVFTVMELALFGFVFNLKVFRDYVDERLDQIAHGRAAEKRASLMLQMDDSHRREVLRLEEVIDGLKERLSSFPSIPGDAVVECRELLGQYIRQSIQRNKLFQGCDGGNLKQLENQIKTMQTLGELFPSELSEQRMAIALKRKEVIARVSVGIRDADYQLATLSELIQLKAEQALTPMLRVDSTINMSSNDLLTPDPDEYARVEDIDMEMMEMGRASSR